MWAFLTKSILSRYQSQPNSEFFFFQETSQSCWVPSFSFSPKRLQQLQQMAYSTQSYALQTGVKPMNISITGSVPQMQVLNHSLPIKLDGNNYLLWCTQIENVVFANGFEADIEGLKFCPPKETSSGEPLSCRDDLIVWS